MTTPVASVIAGVRTALQDTTTVRWLDAELVDYINLAQLDIQRARPDATAETQTLTLVAGARQTIPSAAASLIDIPRNTGGKAISKTDGTQLDAINPNWRNRTPSTTIAHFCHDLRHPRQFEVYPPAQAGTTVDIEVSLIPTAATLGGNVTVGDQWVPPLRSLTLHYAYAKDAEYGGNAALSAAYLQRAEAMLGAQLQTSATVAPKS